MDRQEIKQKWNNFKQGREFQEFYFFAIALILAFGTLQTTGSILDTERPVVTVVSCSMAPEYAVGDIILVQGTEYEDIEVDDIIVYNPESPKMDIPIIHRVISKSSDSLQTQGDNTRGQHDFEKSIEPDQIYGKAAFRIPRIGLVKLVTLDVLGLNGGAPIAIDSTQFVCPIVGQ